MRFSILLRGIFLVLIAGSLMGNQGCEGQEAETKRELRRRVHVGKITAPIITLPPVANNGVAGGSFDFEFVANAQLERVLSETKSFSNASVTGNGYFNPGSVKPGDREEFFRCDAAEPFAISDEAVCMINMPLARVSGQIRDFNMDGGVSIGLGGLEWLNSAEFKYDSATLSMEMKAQDPLIPGYFHATTKSEEGWGRFEGKATLNLLSLTFGGYSQTSLADTVEKAMFKGFAALKQNWDKKNPWHAMVIKSCDKGILISAGDAGDAGLKEGDIVKVQRVQYHWKGQVCNSTLDSTLITDKAFAYYKVQSVGETVSWALRIEDDPEKYPFKEGFVKPGDRVVIEKFAP